MAIDVNRMRPALSTVTGGLSVRYRPVAVRMVWQVAKAVSLPIIGLGGISSTNDAIEFFLAGASAVQIGTYSFVDPSISISIVEGIENYLMSKGFSDIKDIVGYINK